jgi:hypothetical protein
MIMTTTAFLSEANATLRLRGLSPVGKDNLGSQNFSMLSCLLHAIERTANEGHKQAGICCNGFYRLVQQPLHPQCC